MTDKRNIINYFKYWEDEAINAHLDKHRHPFAVLCCNIGGDFNLSTVIRNNNAFLAKEVFIYGRKKWDSRGAVGTHNYSHIHYLPTEKDLDNIKDYIWIGVDNLPGAIPIESYQWPKNALMCFGEESIGLAPEILKRCQEVVYIKQYGSVRSLNVGVASGIAMYDYLQKLNLKLE